MAQHFSRNLCFNSLGKFQRLWQQKIQQTISLDLKDKESCFFWNLHPNLNPLSPKNPPNKYTQKKLITVGFFGSVVEVWEFEASLPICECFTNLHRAFCWRFLLPKLWVVPLPSPSQKARQQASPRKRVWWWYASGHYYWEGGQPNTYTQDLSGML